MKNFSFRNKVGSEQNGIMKMASAYRGLSWLLLSASSLFGIASDEHHLMRGVVMWGICQITAFVMDEIAISVRGAVR